MSRKTKKCLNCGGTGKIVYYTWHEGPTGRATQITEDKPCYRCNGTGKVKIE